MGVCAEIFTGSLFTSTHFLLSCSNSGRRPTLTGLPFSLPENTSVVSYFLYKSLSVVVNTKLPSLVIFTILLRSIFGKSKPSTQPLVIIFILPERTVHEGRICRSNACHFSFTTVCPALWPPLNRMTTSLCSISQSTIFPFPSSHQSHQSTTETNCSRCRSSHCGVSEEERRCIRINYDLTVTFDVHHSLRLASDTNVIFACFVK